MISDAKIAEDLCKAIYPGCRLNIKANISIIDSITESMLEPYSIFFDTVTEIDALKKYRSYISNTTQVSSTSYIQGAGAANRQ